MVQKVTQWTTDCGCSVSFTWDSESPGETRVHTGHESHKLCHGHKPHVKHVDGKPHPHSHFETMLQHCKDKAVAEEAEAAKKSA